MPSTLNEFLEKALKDYKTTNEAVKNYKDIVKKYNTVLNNWRNIIKILEKNDDKSYKKDADNILNMMKKLSEKITSS